MRDWVVYYRKTDMWQFVPVLLLEFLTWWAVNKFKRLHSFQFGFDRYYREWRIAFRYAP